LENARPLQLSMPVESLVERSKQRRQAQPRRIREELKDHLPEQAVRQTSPIVALELRAHRLDQLVVAHPRRTGGDARHAADARVGSRRVGRWIASSSVLPEGAGFAPGRRLDPRAEAAWREPPFGIQPCLQRAQQFGRGWGWANRVYGQVDLIGTIAQYNGASHSDNGAPPAVEGGDLLPRWARETSDVQSERAVRREPHLHIGALRGS